MDHTGRLQLIGKLTYYLGWIALVCGGAMHLNIASGLFRAVQVSQRNLFELGVVSFLIAIASELRAHDSASKDARKDKEISAGLRKAA
jgi:hypothetical protein